MSHAPAAHHWLDPLRSAAWLTRQRVTAWSIILFITELLVILFLALWQHGVFKPVPNPPSADFASFYAAGKLALAGTPQLAYDRTAHWAAEQAATWAGANYQYFFYPPIFLLVCAPLAALPYFVAYAVFQVATLLPFLLAMRAVARAKGWGWLAPVAAFPAVFWTIGVGQNAFLTAALFAGFTLQVDRRPARAGLLLGLLCYKPHFGLLAPVALIAAGRWRAFAAAATTVAALAGVSVAWFGTASWSAYLQVFAGSGGVYQSGAIDFAGIVTPFGAARLLGLAPVAADSLQAAAALAMLAITAMVWRRCPSLNLRAATLLAATLFAVPLALLYDQLLLLVAIGWLAREAHDGGFLPWEKLTLGLLYPAVLLTWPVGSACHVPLGPLATAAVLALSLRRVWRVPAPRPSHAAPEPQPRPAAPAAAVAQPAGATP